MQLERKNVTHTYVLLVLELGCREGYGIETTHQNRPVKLLSLGGNCYRMQDSFAITFLLLKFTSFYSVLKLHLGDAVLHFKFLLM